MTTTLALDPGFGATKVYGPKGGLEIPSAVSVGGDKMIRRMIGLRAVRPPLRVETDAGAFHVGAGAHDWGRPVENLDFDRLAGAPEMIALFLGAMTHYGVPADPVTLIVGLPLAALTGDEAKSTQEGVRSFLRGTHSWCADGETNSMDVENVRITSQPVGAMFDYLLTDAGEMMPDKRAALKGEIAILGLGMNTVELLVVRDGAPVQRFTAGETLGVRRLLELVSRRGLYSLGELDAQLRAGSLDVGTALPVWQSEVLGFVERHWGSSFRRFIRVVAVGGGTVLLRKPLLVRFKSQTYIPDDPVMATARGLYKYSLMRSRRNRRHGKEGKTSQS